MKGGCQEGDEGVGDGSLVGRDAVGSKHREADRACAATSPSTTLQSASTRSLSYGYFAAHAREMWMGGKGREKSGVVALIAALLLAAAHDERVEV
jgi:hypothetical protein